MNRVTGNLFLWLIAQSVSPIQALESSLKEVYSKIGPDLAQQFVLILATPLRNSLSVYQHDQKSISSAQIERTFQAARDGNLDAVSTFIESHKDWVNLICNETGNTLLHEAALAGKVLVVEYLLSQGADPHICNNQGHTSLHCAAAEVTHLKSSRKNNRHIELADITRNKALALKSLLLHADSLARLGKRLSEEQAAELYGESGEKLLSRASWSPEIKRVVENQVHKLQVLPASGTSANKKVQKIPDLSGYIRRFSQSMKIEN